MIKSSKIFKVFLISLLIFSSQTFITAANIVLAATIPPGTYKITDVALIDIGSEPLTIAQIRDLMDKQGAFSQRTGWSAYILECDYAYAYDKYGNKIFDNGVERNPWVEKENKNSGHQDRNDVFSVTGMENRIKNALEAAYPGLGDSLLSYMKSNNILLDIERTEHRNDSTYQGVNYKATDPNANSAHCGPPVKGVPHYAYFYQNDDVYLGATFTVGGPPIDPGPGGGGSCSYTINEGGTGGTVSRIVTTASPSGSISSDSGEFDVVQGIPSSEYLQVDAQSQEYLVHQQFIQKKGEVEYSVPVTQEFTLEWEEETKTIGPDGKEQITKTPKSETETKEATVTVKRPWSYWEIDTYTVHQWDSATFDNYALPGQSVTVPANTNVSASGSHVSSVDQHVFPSDCSEITLPGETITGGADKPDAPDIDESAAESEADSAIGDANVKNDQASFKGSSIMSDSLTPVDGPQPSEVPPPSMVSTQQGGLLIDPLKTNYYRSPSSGSVDYGEVINLNGSGGTKTFPFSVNDVTVHTPVVIYSKASDDKAHDQRTDAPNRSTPANPNTDRHAFILDRPFTVDLPTVGQHRSIPGYGMKDYAKYTRSKQVLFPFDVYTSDKSTFFPANTWINVPVNQEQVQFFLPVWVPEGEYTTLFRAFAINAPVSNFGLQEEANTTIPNGAFNISPAGSQSAAHVVTDTIEVDVVGRLYDFRVTDVLDYNWESVFRTTKGLIEHTGNYYWTGKNSIDGLLRGNQDPFVLPIRQGSHPEGYKNVAVKTGYQFKFDMKTKGDMRNQNDGVHITPTFYFVDKDGKNRRKVDVYYHNDANYFVKIGSPKDKEYRMVTLNEPLRNVPKAQLNNTADYYYRHADNYGYTTEKNQQFISTFIRNFERDYSKKEHATGTYGDQILHWKLRTFIGPLANTVPTSAMIPQADAISSEQQWYGEYSLPAEVYVVDEGKDIAGYGLTNRLNKSHPIFLRDGYLIVNFDIESIQNGDLSKPHLQYINAELTNQWQREGFKYSFTDPYGYTFPLIDGDVIFYHGDQSSLDDFSPAVTH
ncbi:DUF5704 domain-containing protein [Psychrobacillus sp. FSL H8-0484]|uniref:DUF5704 domain-containing protein n=1 Tax=Psychrobacillus sp. FSL H8-0484 TaxID=2921390 RepID=UPI0030FC383E